MTDDQHVRDAEVVVRHVLERLGQEKLILPGRPWGTIFTSRLVMKDAARNFRSKLLYYINMRARECQGDASTGSRCILRRSPRPRQSSPDNSIFELSFQG